MTEIKRFASCFLIATVLSLGCVGGCQQDSREYLQALESKDRLIHGSHKARKDMIDSLTSRSLSRADQAMEADSNFLEQNLYVEERLDSFRPHAPNPSLFEQASDLAKSLEQDRIDLLAKWVDALRDMNPDTAKELSSKILDIDLALAEATETAKRSRP